MSDMSAVCDARRAEEVRVCGDGVVVSSHGGAVGRWPVRAADAAIRAVAGRLGEHRGGDDE